MFNKKKIKQKPELIKTQRAAEVSPSIEHTDDKFNVETLDLDNNVASGREYSKIGYILD